MSKFIVGAAPPKLAKSSNSKITTKRSKSVIQNTQDTKIQLDACTFEKYKQSGPFPNVCTCDN